MKVHATAGDEILQQVRFPFPVAKYVRYHHERWDGEGYPGYVDVQTGKALRGYAQQGGRPIGKKAEEIPLYGRIVALADVYDALSSARVYKEAWDESEVLDKIESESGRHFDPELVEIFFSSLDFLRTVQQRYRDPE